MANMFKCALAGGGDGASLIVTCTQNFAGSTITLTNGTKTYTQVCPLTSPYEVIFESIATGIWTVSGIAQGQTFSTSVTITDFEALLADIPEGATVTPTDDIQTWLHCAEIFDKSYTTISQVLSDTTTLLALISSTNAVDYMVRSTTWASSVCSNSTAMSDINGSAYCANKLLGDSTWRAAVCNSTYFETVLTTKVPTMTSATAPSGKVSASSEFNSTYAAYKAFDNNQSTSWISIDHSKPYTDHWIEYDFTSNTKVYKFNTDSVRSNDGVYIKNFVIEAYNGTTWEQVGSFTHGDNTNSESFILNPTQAYQKWRFRLIDSYRSLNTVSAGAYTMQFYGRA